MADLVSGIRPIPPTFPVRPTLPSNKDREPGRERKRREPESGEGSEKPPGPGRKPGPDPGRDPGTDNQPTIDEHV